MYVTSECICHATRFGRVYILPFFPVLVHSDKITSFTSHITHYNMKFSCLTDIYFNLSRDYSPYKDTKNVDTNDMYASMRHTLVLPGTQGLDAAQTSLGAQFPATGLFSQGASKSKISTLSLRELDNCSFCSPLNFLCDGTTYNAA